MLAHYIGEYVNLGPEKVDLKVLIRLGDHMAELIAWQARNLSRVKVADD